MRSTIANISAAASPIILYSDNDYGCQWETSYNSAQDNLYKLSVNIALYAADGADTVNIRQIIHNGDWDPDPDSIEHLRDQIISRTEINATAGDVNLETDDLSDVDMLYITGHNSFSFSEAQKTALKKFINNGGVLFADDCSASGNGGFETSVKQLISEMYGTLETLPAEHSIYSSHYTLNGNDFSYSAGLGTPHNTAPLTYFLPVVGCIEDTTGQIDIAPSKARYGETVNVPVKINNAPNEVSAFGFDITYDPKILTYKDFTKGTLIENFDYFDVYLISDGLLRCGGFTDDNAIAKDGSGNLVCLNFDVAENAAKSKVELTALEDDISTWTASSGCFSPGCTGDINQDGKITPQDALCAFEKYMGICPTSCNIPCADVCADVNYDNDVTPADALCIFNKYLGKTSCLETGPPSCN